jgi:hypothetical protein
LAQEYAGARIAADMHSDLAVRLVVAAVPEGSFCAVQGSRRLLAAVEHVIVCRAPIEGRVDLAIQVGSAIEPVPHAHVQVTADRRPGAGPGLL